jgi:hypothetical protein
MFTALLSGRDAFTMGEVKENTPPSLNGDPREAGDRLPASLSPAAAIDCMCFRCLSLRSTELVRSTTPFVSTPLFWVGSRLGGCRPADGFTMFLCTWARCMCVSVCECECECVCKMCV